MMVNVTLDELRARRRGGPALARGDRGQQRSSRRSRSTLLEQVDAAPELIADAKQASETLDTA